MDTLAVAPTTRVRTDRTVRSLAWKILLANHRPSLGLEAWDELVDEVDGPGDVKHLSLEEPSPLDPFCRALEAIAAEIAEDSEEGLERVGRGFVDRWASMYQTLVDHLEGRPERMLDLAVEEIVPWFFAGAELELADLGSGEARLRWDPALPAGFQAGMLEAFLAQVGVEASIDRDERLLLVTWETTEPESPHPIRILAEATRARFLTVTVVPVLVGTALAFLEGTVSMARGGAALAAAAALHLSANLLNDVYDHRRGVDEANLTPTPFSGGSRVIQRGLLGTRRVLGLALGLGVAGVGLGLWLAATTGPAILGLGVLGVLVGYAYSGDPIRLSHRGLGELAAGLVFGPLIAAGAHTVQTGSLAPEGLLVGVPLGAMMAGLLAVTELSDAPWDERTGKHTLVVRLGEQAPAAIAATFAAAYLSLAGLVVAGVLAWPVLVALGTAPLAVHVVRGIRRAGFEADELVAYQSAAFWLHASTGLLITAGIAAGGIL